MKPRHELRHEPEPQDSLDHHTSPYSWDEQFTEKQEWLGGKRVAGGPFTTREGLRECLTPAFSLIGQPRSIPFVLRETQRKFQHSLSEVTVWERHGEHHSELAYGV